MSALPKNKITRCEQGKRRSGNRPNLIQNPKHASIPLGKKKLAEKILATFKVGKVTHELKKNREVVVTPNKQISPSTPTKIIKQTLKRMIRQTQNKGS